VTVESFKNSLFRKHRTENDDVISSVDISSSFFKWYVIEGLLGHHPGSHPLNTGPCTFTRPRQSVVHIREVDYFVSPRDQGTASRNGLDLGIPTPGLLLPLCAVDGVLKRAVAVFCRCHLTLMSSFYFRCECRRDVLLLLRQHLS
jgi:hypothetical protein